MTINPFILHGEEVTPVRKLLYLKAFAGGGALSEYELTGNPVAFNTNVAKPLSGFTVPFLPVQSGTGDPSPENVRPISGWTGVNARRTGVNLFHPVESEMVSAGWNSIFPNPIKKAGKYSFSCQNTFGGTGTLGCRVTFCDEATNQSPAIGSALFGYNFGKNDGYRVFEGVTITEEQANANYMRFEMNSSGTTFASISNAQIQIEYGETASPYAEYTGASYPVVFPAMGANQFNGAWVQGNIAAGVEQPSTTAMRTGFIDVDPSTAYYAYTTRTTNIFLFEYDENGTYLNIVTNISNGKSFTTSAATKKVRIADRNSGTETVNTGINYPATVTAYEPFTNTIYGGTVYPLDGRMLVEWEYAVLNDPDKWSEVSDNNYKFIYDTGFPQRKKYQDSYTDLLCSSFVADSTKRLYCRWNVASGGKFAIQDKYSTLTLADVKQMATSGNIAIAFPIATPYEIQLDPITVQTLIGDNTIWTDTNGENTIRYKKKG